MEPLLREIDRESMRQPPSSPKPAVLVLDDLPIVPKRGSGSRGWSVLAAAQVVWENPAWEPAQQTRLRLLRALPTNNQLAWEVFLDELSPYEPSYVVCDGATAIHNAIRARFGTKTQIIPSMFHTRRNIEKALYQTPRAWLPDKRRGKVLTPQVAELVKMLRLKQLTAYSEEQWVAWWDTLLAVLTTAGSPHDVVDRARIIYEPQLAALRRYHESNTNLPLSTGGLEVLLADKIKTLLQRRGHAFSNLERTNRLFDLVVCHDRGLFLDHNTVARLIADDNEQHDGWSYQPRMVGDKKVKDPTGSGNKLSQTSLHNIALLHQYAMKRGITSGVAW